MYEQVYVLGAGGHGRVVLDMLFANNVPVAGILDPGVKPLKKLLGVPILGGDEYLDGVSADKAFLVNGLGANPKTLRRQGVFSAMKARGFSFRSLIHPSAVIGSSVTVDEGCQIMAGAVIQCEVKLGENVVVNTRASIDHNCTIESHAFIAPGAVLCGGIVVCESAFIGAGAVVVPDIQIGRGAIVGAGAVVIRCIPSCWIVVGNPAVKIGESGEYVV